MLTWNFRACNGWYTCAPSLRLEANTAMLVADWLSVSRAAPAHDLHAAMWKMAGQVPSTLRGFHLVVLLTSGRCLHCEGACILSLLQQSLVPRREIDGGSRNRF